MLLIIFGRLVRIISYYNQFNIKDNNEILNILHEIHDNFIQNYFYVKCIKDNKSESLENRKTLSDWKSVNSEIVNIYEKDQTLKYNIGGIIVDWMIESNLVQTKTITVGWKEKKGILIPSDDLLNVIGNDIDKLKLSVRKIPMIVKPKLYRRENIENKRVEKLGGYLLNDVSICDPLIIPNWELKHNTDIKDVNKVYDLVNNINSVGYKINKDVLDFIDMYDDQYHILLDRGLYNHLEKKSKESKLTKTENKELVSHLSKVDLQDNVLNLARLFYDLHEFYLPVRIDNRGRVYCISEYLNYQSNELAKYFLLFSKGEKISKTDKKAIDYLKAYGANSYGNKLDKKP